MSIVIDTINIKKIIFLVILLFSGFFETLDAQATGSFVRARSVVFSSTAPSGTMNLTGTLFLPETIVKPVPGVVFVAGSGPESRYEDYNLNFLNFDALPPQEPYCSYKSVSGIPFAELAIYLTKELGFVTLIYDKRSCLLPHCNYYPCGTIFETNCLNLTTLTVWDFIDDGASALKFLSSIPEVDKTKTYLLGHSQGVTLVPYIAKSVFPEISVAGLLLLMGSGRPIDLTIERQFAANIAELQTGIPKYCNRSDPVQEVIIQNADASISLNQQILQAAKIYFPKIRNGDFPPFMELCIAGCATVAFWNSWFFITNQSEIRDRLTEFASRGGKIFALNSPSDKLVSPVDYLPLESILFNLTRTSVEVIDGLTHYLSPSDFSTGNVDPLVFVSIQNWFLNSN